MAKETKVKYTEPDDYFPKSVRKKNKIGEYAEPKKTDKGTAKNKKK